MPILLELPKLGEPHKEGEPLVCNQCHETIISSSDCDRMIAKDGRTWLFCEDCSVAFIKSAKIETDH
jgi:hypothetical protein